MNTVLSFITSPRAACIAGKPLLWLKGRTAESGVIDLSGIRRALVIRLDEIGDVILTTPFLRELRNNLPRAWITLIVKPSVYNLVQMCPYVDEVLTYEWGSCGTLTELVRHGRALKLAILSLWKRRYDMAILPRWYPDFYHASFLAYFSLATLRVAYSESVEPRKQKMNKDYDMLFTHLIKDDSIKHEVEHDLDVIRFLKGSVKDDALELWLGEDDIKFGERFLKDYGIGGSRSLIGLCAGSHFAKKRWPVELFAELAKRLIMEYHLKIVLLGGDEDRYIGTFFKETFREGVIDMIGKTTLRQAAALLGHCRLYIGNDIGLKHIAAAMHVPVVEISSWSKSGSDKSEYSPAHFGPWKTKYVLVNPQKPISPCSEECVSLEPHCITLVRVEDVMEAARKLL